MIHELECTEIQIELCGRSYESEITFEWEEGGHAGICNVVLLVKRDFWPDGTYAPFIYRHSIISLLDQEQLEAISQEIQDYYKWLEAA